MATSSAFVRPSSGRTRNHRAERTHSPHAGEAADPAAARQPEQDRLRLVVGMVRGDDVVGADRQGVPQQQVVARDARPLLQAALGLRPASSATSHAASRACAGGRSHRVGFGAGLGAEPVIDGRDADRRRRVTCPPGRGKMQEGERIGAAGDGQQAGRRARHGREQRRKIERRRRRSVRAPQVAGHWRRLASRSAPDFAVVALGYLRPISPKVAQACSLAPSAFKDWPSRSMASGARGAEA